MNLLSEGQSYVLFVVHLSPPSCSVETTHRPPAQENPKKCSKKRWGEVRSAERIIGSKLPSLHSLYRQRALKQIKGILETIHTEPELILSSFR